MKFLNLQNKIVLFLTMSLSISLQAKEIYLDSRQVSQLNHFSPLEAAGSHGSIGYNLGLGVQNVKTEYSDSINVTRIYATKGFSIPLDLGISIGTVPNTPITLLSGYAQYTVAEKLKWPALSIRSSASTILGLNKANRSVEITGVASYGFLRYFTLFTFSGFQYSYQELDAVSLKLLAVDPTSEEQASSLDLFYGYGMQIKLFNPLYKISIESSKNMRSESTISAKIGYGF